jgi:hypothetical protein
MGIGMHYSFVLIYKKNYFTVCEYKNKQYTQGQHWTDGCQYNCSCEDAAIGYYRCRNL